MGGGNRTHFEPCLCSSGVTSSWGFSSCHDKVRCWNDAESSALPAEMVPDRRPGAEASPPRLPAALPGTGSAVLTVLRLQGIAPQTRFYKTWPGSKTTCKTVFPPKGAEIVHFCKKENHLCRWVPLSSVTCWVAACLLPQWGTANVPEQDKTEASPETTPQAGQGSVCPSGSGCV